jgi:hypothetical protein
MANQKNLIPAKKGEVRNPYGRPRKLSKALRTIPQDAQEKIYGILHYAISLGSVAEASEYIKTQRATDVEYGVVLQLAEKALLGKNGWQALNDIMDRLFGKPKQVQDVAVSGNLEGTHRILRIVDE